MEMSALVAADINRFLIYLSQPETLHQISQANSPETDSEITISFVSLYFGGLLSVTIDSTKPASNIIT
jgi:hypothetical protein